MQTNDTSSVGHKHPLQGHRHPSNSHSFETFEKSTEEKGILEATPNHWQNNVYT